MLKAVLYHFEELQGHVWHPCTGRKASSCLLFWAGLRIWGGHEAFRIGGSWVAGGPMGRSGCVQDPAHGLAPTPASRCPGAAPGCLHLHHFFRSCRYEQPHLGLLLCYCSKGNQLPLLQVKPQAAPTLHWIGALHLACPFQIWPAHGLGLDCTS